MSSSRQPSWQPWLLEELSHTKAHPAQTAVNSSSRDEESPEQEVARLRAEARRNGYEAGLKQGRDEGYQAGFAQGQEEGKAEGLVLAEQEAQQALNEVLQPMGELILQANTAFCQMKKELADDVVDLAITVGRYLARAALDRKPEEIISLVRELLHDEHGLSGKPRLLLNSADLIIVREHLGTEISRAEWQLQADDNLQRGGCKLLTAAGEIDASWEARCQNIIGQLRRTARASAPSGKPTTTGEA